MSKAQLLLVVILLAGTLGVLHGRREASAHSGYYYVTANALNLRTGPGGNYEVLRQIPQNAIVKVRGHRGTPPAWFYLTYDGTTGWASAPWMKPYTPPPSAPPPSSGGRICLTNYWGVYVCSSENVGNAIRYWAAQYGLGWWGLAATAACESDFLPGAYNASSGVSGLFQFMPSTFYAYGGQSLWDVWDQSRVAAKMFSQGLAYHWHCARLLQIA